MMQEGDFVANTVTLDRMLALEHGTYRVFDLVCQGVCSRNTDCRCVRALIGLMIRMEFARHEAQKAGQPG